MIKPIKTERANKANPAAVKLTQAKTQEAIKDVIGGLFANFDRTSIQQYAALADNPAIRKAAEAARTGEQSDFYYALIYPIDRFIDALLKVEMRVKDDQSLYRAHFLMKEGDFVSRHFSRLIEASEGRACCADKTRTIMSALALFYLTGEEIAFDRTQEYTFHLPKVIFTTHTEIIDFFDALYFLHAGQPVKYLSLVLPLNGPGPSDNGE